jgi:GntR family transcriptional regulator
MDNEGDVRNVCLMHVDHFDPTPKFRQLANILRARITSGELKPRDPIPSESSMVADHDIARDTARAAVALLREEGYVITLPQRGTYVAPKENWPAE